MSFPAYPAYRESGIDWLEFMPSDWEVKALRSLAQDGRYTFIDGDWVETPYIVDEGIRLLQTGNIGVGYFKEQGFRYISSESFDDLDCTEVKPGDVLICRLAEPVGRACLAPDLGVRMITSVDVCILKPRDEVVSSYLVYLLSSPDYLGFMEGQCRGGTRDRVSRSFLGSIRIPLPSTAEQSAITAFLDRETSKIDALVAEQERLIALLKEKRQAVISQAVTKGLDPNAPMKPSGVAWLGEVPAHWELRKLATALREPPCYGVLVPDFESDGVPMLRITDVTDGHADRETLTTISPSLSAQYQRTIVQAGDVAISVVGTIGEAIRIDASLAGVNLSRALARLQPTDNLSADFLCFLVQSEFFKCFVDLVCVGTAQRVLNMSALASLSIALPPIEEQVAIAGNLEGALARLSQLTSEAERAITLLRERRAALISAAVTGKIDVRGAVPGAQEAA